MSNTEGDRAALEQTFAWQFEGLSPSHLIRAPGRVNLIGEHIDYNGLPVLPMAIEREVRLLCRARHDTTVRMASTRTEFPLREFCLTDEIPSYASGDWGNYAKAAAQGLVKRLGRLKGLDALIDSDIPVAAGLSSSSALVVAVALGLLAVNDVTVEGHELMELLAQAERYVGTQGGGMDHAICLGAEEGHATRIEFDPVQLTPVPVPPRWRFVVASSLVPAEKSGRVKAIYNRRTQECREALAAVTAHFGVSEVSYRHLMQEVPVNELTRHATGLLDSPLDRRFRHVVTEAERVRRAEEALRGEDLERFGSLLNESHRSLRGDYEVSAPELDQLTEIALAAGAPGSRLTGAGLGGCTVSVCTVERVDAVLEALHQEFYAVRDFDGRLEDQLFIATPAAGAQVTRL